MGASVFFIDWQLWEQMTFVLGCAILLVFTAGSIKLWWMNRRVRQITKLDEEKKSRLSEIRRTGLAMTMKGDIPFGVRAIQKGIEVDGIWISRPGTPNSETPLMSTPVNFGAFHVPKGKDKAVPTIGVTGVGNSTRKSPRTSPQAGTYGYIPSDQNSPSAVPNNRTSYRPKHAPSKPTARSIESYNADALSLLEGSSSNLPVQTYTPTSSRLEPHAKTSYIEESPLKDDPDYFGEREPANPFADPVGSEQPSPMEQITPVERAYTAQYHDNHSSGRVNFDMLPSRAHGQSPEF